MSGPKSGAGEGADYYTRRAASPEYRRSRVEKAEVVRHLMGDRLARAECIADVGTGTGIMKRALEEATGARIVGFEIDVPFVVERRWVVGADACRLPAADGTFDLLLLNHLYEHVEDQAALFREARRVLRPGGVAYVTAGSRWAVMEPHYRLPFLSWLPPRAADAYLRASGRGRAYRGVRFRGYGALLRLMRAAGFTVHDVTERALEGLLGPDRGRAWRPVWAGLRRLPGKARKALLRVSPQWFFILEREEVDEMRGADG